MVVEMMFPVQGVSIPADHAYSLYGALSGEIPAFHEPTAGVRFAPINGMRIGKALIQPTNQSLLRIRLSPDRIPEVLQLAGKKLKVGEHWIRLSIPSITQFQPAEVLGARMVTYKNATDPARFLTQTRLRLEEIGITGEASIPQSVRGRQPGEPCRRVMRIKGKRIVGFALVVAGLDPQASITLMERGLGGRCRIGCGFFVPIRPQAK